MDPNPTRAKTQHTLRVLIADDNVPHADSLCVILNIWRYDVSVAYTGAQALEQARDYRPDCMILDIGMPIMDGYAVAQHIREDAGLKRTKLVALTAYSDEGSVRRSREAGFDHHLVKPVDLVRLRELLEKSAPENN